VEDLTGFLLVVLYLWADGNSLVLTYLSSANMIECEDIAA
jgi:hypothetical protein